MPTETALERLRRLAGLPPARDATAVVKPKPKPRTISPLPDLTDEEQKELTRSKGRELHREDKRLGTSTPTLPKADHALITPPGRPNLRAQSDATAVRVITPPVKETEGHRTIGPQKPEGNVDSDYLRGFARERENAANYQQNRAMGSAASRLEDEAQINQQRPGALGTLASRFVKSATAGASQRIPLVRDALDPERVADERMKGRKLSTASELRKTGVLTDTDETPALAGEGNDFNRHGAAGMIGDLAGFAVPIGLQNRLIKSGLEAGALAGRTRGFSRLSGIQQAQKLTRGFENPGTLLGKMAKTGGEFVAPGAGMAASDALDRNEDPAKAAAASLLPNALMGAAFPVGGKALGVVKKAVPFVREGAEELGKSARHIFDGQVEMAPHAVDGSFIPNDKPVRAIDQLRKLAMPVAAGAMLHPKGQDAMRAIDHLRAINNDPRAMKGALAASGAYALANIDDQSDEGNKALPLALAAAGTLAFHGHEHELPSLHNINETYGAAYKAGLISKAEHDVFDQGWRLEPEHTDYGSIWTLKNPSGSIVDHFEDPEDAVNHAIHSMNFRSKLASANKSVTPPEGDDFVDAYENGGHWEIAPHDQSMSPNHPLNDVDWQKKLDEIEADMNENEALKAAKHPNGTVTLKVVPSGTAGENLWQVIGPAGSGMTFKSQQKAEAEAANWQKKLDAVPNQKSHETKFLKYDDSEDLWNVVTPEGKVVSKHTTYHEAQKAQGKPVSTEYTIATHNVGGYTHYTLVDPLGESLWTTTDETAALAKKKKFQEQLDAEIPKKTAAISPETKEPWRVSKLAGQGLLGQSVEEHAARFRAGHMERRAKNLERFMKGSRVRYPLLHGTTHDFDTFERGELGFHFTGDPEAAAKRLPVKGTGNNYSPTPGATTGHMMPVWVNIKNPLRTEDPGSWLGPSFRNWLYHNKVIDATERSRLDKAANSFDAQWNYQNADARRWAEGKDLRDLLKSKGYDGIVYENGYERGGDSYIAFDSNQIKSVTGNKGTYNAKKLAITSGAAIAAKLLADDDEKNDDRAKIALAAGAILTHHGVGPGAREAIESQLRDVVAARKQVEAKLWQVWNEKEHDPVLFFYTKNPLALEGVEWHLELRKLDKAEKALKMALKKLPEKPPLPDEAGRLALAGGGAVTALGDGDEKKKKLGALALGIGSLAMHRKVKPTESPAFFSRADKFFDEGGLERAIKTRPAKDGVSMRGKTPETAAEWKQMLFNEPLSDVNRKELQIRLGEQLDIAEEEGRKLSKQDVREMLADNPIRVQVHVIGKPIAGSENIDIAGGQIENAANYDQGNGDFSKSPFEDWTLKGGDDYRSLVITAEPTKLYRPDNSSKRAHDVILEHDPRRDSWSAHDPSTGDLLEHPDGKQMFDLPTKGEATRRATEALHNSGWKGDRINLAAVEEGDPYPTVSSKVPANLVIKPSADGEGYDVYLPSGELIPPQEASGATREDAEWAARNWWRRQGYSGSPILGDSKGMVGRRRYNEPHYGEGGWIHGGGFDNVIAHVRVKTRMIDGKKTLHVEEAQSTLGQDITKYGADGSPERKAKIKESKARIAEITDEVKALMGDGKPAKDRDRKAISRRIRELAGKINDWHTPPDEKAALNAERDALIKQRSGMPLAEQAAQHESVQKLLDEKRKLANLLGELQEKNHEGNTPELPLTSGVGEYTDAMLRTVLDIAAREGHERIVWTGGLDQTARYDDGLQKIADKILWNPKTNAVRVENKGAPVDGIPDKMNPGQLRAYFGGNIADRLASGEQKVEQDGSYWHHVGGSEITIGKKGMVNYYDNVLPKWFEKEARRLGIKIEFTENKLEDARSETDAGAHDLTIGSNDEPLYIDADELEYRLDQARSEGAAPSALAIGRRVLRNMRDVDTDFQQATDALSPEKRQMLAELLGEDTFSPSGAGADRSAHVQGFDVPPDLPERIMGGNYLYANPLDPAKILALYKAHPTAFSGGALVGAGAITSKIGDDEKNQKLEWTGKGLIGLGALHALGAHKTRSGKPLYQDISAKAGRSIVDALKDQNIGGLKGRHILDFISHDILATPELRKAADEFERDRAKAAAVSLEFKAKLRRLGDIANRGVTDLITGETWEPNVTKLSPDEARAMVAAAEELRNEFSFAGSEEVAHGTMARGQFEKYDQEYMPYLYPEYEALQARGVGKGEAPTSVPRVRGHKTREEIPLDKRQKMGQIREADYLAQKGLQHSYNNIAAAKLFTALSAIPGSLHPEYEKAVRDLMAANKSGKARAVKIATAKLKRIRMEAMGDLDRGQLAGYRTLPNSRGLGVLSGAVVRNDIASYLEGLPAFGKRSLVDEMFMQWKKIHTVWNPGTHVGNFASNIVTAHMKGLPMHEQFLPGPWGRPALAAANSEIKRYGRYARALTEAGVMDQNIATMDYGAGMDQVPRRAIDQLRDLAGRTLPETADKLKEMEITPKSQNKVLVKGRKADAWLAEKYNLEDNWFRTALLQKVTKPVAKGGLGLNMDQGVEYVRHHMGDFRTRSAALKMAKWYSPFVMYPAKMVPHMLGSVIEHPFRWMTLAASWGVIDQLGQMAAGPIDEMDMPEDQRSSRGFGYLVPGAVQTPFKSGRTKFASDVSRYTPFSSLSGQAAPGSLAAALSSRVPAIAAPGGPLADLYARNINTDPYTGEKFIGKNDTVGEKVAKLGGSFVANQVLPSAVAWHLPRVLKDLDNRDYQRAGLDALGFAGLRPRTVIPGQRATQDEYWYQDSNEEAARDLAKDLRAAKRNPAKQQRLKLEYRDKLKRINAEYKRRNTRPE